MSRRKLKRAIRTLIENDGDRCSLCHTAFSHNSRTYGGTTAAGVPALVGECCASKLETVVATGLYLTRSYQGFAAGTGSGRSYSIEETARAIDAHQRYFAEVDRAAKRS
jgi:hypothetical protein